MARIIISYRRSDSDVFAGRIRDRIASRYGDNSVFMDIDDIPFGKDFRQHIKDALTASDAVVVIIGPRWLGTGKGGHTRIQDEDDPVRIEVETALQRNIPIIPVLEGDTKMPKPSQLPHTMKDFAFINAAPVDTGRDFHPHMQRLLRQLDRILGAETAQPIYGRPDSAREPEAGIWPQRLKVGVALIVATVLIGAGLSLISPISSLMRSGPTLTTAGSKAATPAASSAAEPSGNPAARSVAGLDCAQPGTGVERTICETDELWSKHKLAIDLYSFRQSRNPADERLKAEQLSWRNGLEQCQGEGMYGCIYNAHEVRIGQLRRGPSYPCHIDKNRVEQAICKDVLLSTKDQAMHDVYHDVTDTMLTMDSRPIQADQLNWLHKMRDACDEPKMIACISRAYDLRLAQLDELARRR